MEIVTHARRRHRGLHVLGTGLSVLMTLVALAFMAPSLFGLQRYVITGTSMTGTLDRGSIALEEVVPIEELRVGDVITYAPPAGSGIEDLVTHRIVAMRGNAFRTKGDAVPHPDPWTFRLSAPEQSRVRFSVPYAGYPLMVLGDRTGRILLVAIPSGLITVYSFLQVVRELRRRLTRSSARAEDAAPAAHGLAGTQRLT